MLAVEDGRRPNALAGAETAAELRSLSDELGRWAQKLAAAGHADRGIVEHDRLDDEGLPLFPELLVVGTKLPTPVLANLVAFPGAEIRSFKPAWARVVQILGLSGRDKSNPLGGLGTIGENRARLEAVKQRLDLRAAVSGLVAPTPVPTALPVPKRRTGLWIGLAAGAAALVAVVATVIVRRRR